MDIIQQQTKLCIDTCNDINEYQKHGLSERIVPQETTDCIISLILKS